VILLIHLDADNVAAKNLAGMSVEPEPANG
jgi:hypothetical protein